ncbi:hypothetical protein [Frankia sp. QA3]|uniref:hypothetical protein n=1 Tax=Frankia sp. QA3 TaxID=710111 RepID=UPI000269C862|nr:hypothetical protein [Frankia sp. QA3]EIV93680.1 hypothetical protein FraQA3DRAFT_3391 [Frankia sp. QA3]
MSGLHDGRWSRPARRAIAEELPEFVASTMLELATGALREDPRRVGKPLHELFDGTSSASRATLRMILQHR